MLVKSLVRHLFLLQKPYPVSKNWRRYCHASGLKQENATEFANSMSAWQITSFTNEKNLQFCTNVDVPIIDTPDHVLIKVAAASVNPLDVEMKRKFNLSCVYQMFS